MILTRLKTIFLAFLVSLVFEHHSICEIKKINVYGWSEYIAPETLKQFTEQTGIGVTYDSYDSDEMLDAKLLSGNTGYDLVFPSHAPYLYNHVQLDLYTPLDKKKLPNYKHLDATILNLLKVSDPTNSYAIPWMWSATGIGYDIDKIKEIDPKAPTNSLELIFNPKYAKKFEKCGIYWFNFGPEMIGLALLYHGKNPNDISPENLELAKNTLQSVRKYVKSISNSSYSNFANNDICITIGMSSEIFQDLRKIKHSKTLSSKNFKVSLPKEGFLISIDTMAIPKTSTNVENTHKFINFLMDPKVAAYNSNNYTQHMNGNASSYPMLIKEIKNNKTLNPSSNLLKCKAYSLKPQPLSIRRERNRMWTTILTSKNNEE